MIPNCSGSRFDAPALLASALHFPTMERAAKGFAVAATIGMFLVLLMGATVTNTGSGEGCGTSWPLCHGEFIPEYAFETMVEYSHRLVTGVEGLIILGLAI